MKRVLLAAALLLAATVHQANAAPISTPGDYDLTSGLIGTFTSDGSGMTVFSFTGPQGVIWDNANPLQFETTNTANTFVSSYFFVGELRIEWDDNTWVYQPDGCVGAQCSERGTLAYTSSTTEPVPEPATLALVALGAAGLGIGRRRGE